MGAVGTYRYVIGGHLVEVNAQGVDIESVASSMAPFLGEVEAAPILSVSVKRGAREYCLPIRVIGDFDTGSGNVKVERDDASGRYAFLIRNMQEKPVAQLFANSDFSCCRIVLLGGSEVYAFSSAIMIAYSYSAARFNTLLIHASCVLKDGNAYAFVAKSGTGKSTQAANWLRYVPDCELLNDDNPIVRVESGVAYAYGSPWSGKTPCYRNVKASLKAITRIDRAAENSIEALNPVAAFSSLLPSCATMPWDTVLYGYALNTISKIIPLTGHYILHCLPDRESAELCYETIKKQESR